MVFSSNVFLLLFLPLFLSVYYLTPNKRRMRNYAILAGSYFFYGWWRLDFLALFAAVTVFNYFIGAAIGNAGVGQPRALRWTKIGVVINLGVLGYFKYANFGVSSFNDLVASFGFEPFSMTSVLLPIGISFYIFESISYIVDVYRGDAKATKHPVDFATFVSLFPHLIAGPIFRYKDLADQFEQREHSADLFGRGATRFMQGFVKKVIVADTVAPLADYCFSLTNPSTADAWLGTFAYTVQLYFDFSGYSDMAIGLGLMIGFRFMENFKAPYISQSITEFWRRWHISLSSWLRDYLYIPLGGNRNGNMATHRNVIITFFLGGVWHGANWTFLVWGAMQGFMIFIERVLGISGAPKQFRLVRWTITFVLVMVSWTVFRAASINDAWRMYQAMFFMKNIGGFTDPMLTKISGLQVGMLLLAILVVLVEGLREFGPRLKAPSQRVQTAAILVFLLPLFFLSIMKLSAQGYSAFLYFQF
ncbi:MBOAT family O-acyltransferase [Nevskia ramosa]|uniref:MBOAT family O-acyltransferase n=1 Tax=Nevskia ramosa TaxID=64002 RepID=UPI0003B794A5